MFPHPYWHSCTPMSHKYDICTNHPVINDCKLLNTIFTGNRCFHITESSHSPHLIHATVSLWENCNSLSQISRFYWNIFFFFWLNNKIQLRSKTKKKITQKINSLRDFIRVKCFANFFIAIVFLLPCHVFLCMKHTAGSQTDIKSTCDY